MVSDKSIGVILGLKFPKQKEEAVAEWLSSWLVEQEVRVRFPASPLEFQGLVISCFQVTICLNYRLDVYIEHLKMKEHSTISDILLKIGRVVLIHVSSHCNFVSILVKTYSRN